MQSQLSLTSLSRPATSGPTLLTPNNLATCPCSIPFSALLIISHLCLSLQTSSTAPPSHFQLMTLVPLSLRTQEHAEEDFHMSPQSHLSTYNVLSYLTRDQPLCLIHRFPSCLLKDRNPSRKHSLSLLHHQFSSSCVQML